MSDQSINKSVKQYIVLIEDGDMDMKLSDILMASIPDTPKGKIRKMIVEMEYDLPG